MLQFIKDLFGKNSEDQVGEYLPLEEKPDYQVPQDGPWIGVDLDGTLAKHDLWVSKFHVGKPVPQMMKRVKMWIDRGIRVKINDDGKVHVGGGNAEPTLASLKAQVRQNRDRRASFDHALDMGQRSQ